MKCMIKKLIIYLIISMIQVGLGTIVIEASPLSSNSLPRIVQLDDGHSNDDRQRDLVKRLREERARHEQEMQRRDNESDQDYRERQNRENERHENALHDLEILLNGISIGY